MQAAHPGGKVEVTERLKLAKLQFSTTLWAFILYEGAYCKVEKILKGSLDLIPSPSPSVNIQIMCGKVHLMRKSKKIAGRCQHPVIFCLYAFPAHNFNVMGLNPGYLLKYLLLYLEI